MSINPNRQPAGTPNGGQFSAGSTQEASLSLHAGTPYDNAAVYGQQVSQAQEQIKALTAQIDQDSARELGCFLRGLHPDATHARLVWEGDRWYLNSALAANGNELDIDWDSTQWYDYEDGIDTACSHMSRNIADRPTIAFNPGDDELSNGDETIVDVRPEQQ